MKTRGRNDPQTGTWNNPAPFAGELEVSGFIDGGSSPVPESAPTLVLLAVGLYGMCGARIGQREGKMITITKCGWET